jgi:hypothetical protein
MYYTNVKIIRDSNTIYQKLVPSHEVEVLKHVFDSESVIPQSGFVVTDRPYPSPEDEFLRLRKAYGDESVLAAYKTAAEMWEAIPLLARVATKVVSAVSNFRFRPQERADLRTPKTEQEAAEEQRESRATHEGMREAIERSLLGIPDHDAERGRFRS